MLPNRPCAIRESECKLSLFPLLRLGRWNYPRALRRHFHRRDRRSGLNLTSCGRSQDGMSNDNPRYYSIHSLSIRAIVAFFPIFLRLPVLSILELECFSYTSPLSFLPTYTLICMSSRYHPYSPRINFINYFFKFVAPLLGRPLIRARSFTHPPFIQPILLPFSHSLFTLTRS